MKNTAKLGRKWDLWWTIFKSSLYSKLLMVIEELISTHVSNLTKRWIIQTSGETLNPDACMGLTPNPLTQCGPGAGNLILMDIRVRLTHLVFSSLQAELYSDHSWMITIYPTFTDLLERRYLVSLELIFINKTDRKVSVALACAFTSL